MLLVKRPVHLDVSGVFLLRKAIQHQLFQTWEYLATQFALLIYQSSFAICNYIAIQCEPCFVIAIMIDCMHAVN